MRTKVQMIPTGYQAIMPYLMFEEGLKAIEWYKKAFRAVERLRLDAPEGKLGHAEIMIGESAMMMADECPKANGVKSPKALGASSVAVHLYVEDVDSFIQHAVSEGAILLSPPEDKFYGDRNGSLQDPFGHVWFVSTHIEDITPEEMKSRAQNLFGS